MPPTVPTKFYKPHARLEKDLRTKPPTLKCCVAFWVEAGKKLVEEAPEDIPIPHSIIRYTIVEDTDPNFATDRWEHFKYNWPWPDYHNSKLITNVIDPVATSITNSSDRAEPCTD